MSHLQSSGRGGAGNIVESTKSPKIKPQDLETPTLKESVVTTGRGGSGNMTKNKDAAKTRALQDVEPYVVFLSLAPAPNFIAASSTFSPCEARRVNDLYCVFY